MESENWSQPLGQQEDEEKREPSASSSVSKSIPKYDPAKVKIMALNDTKAGMEGLDVDKINEIIQKTSEGSKFYKHKQKMQENLDKRLNEMKEQLKRFSDADIKRSERQMNEMGEDLEKERDLEKFIVHIDMDAFFAAVEMRDNPNLRNVPMAVGGMSMLATSNYIARKFGVRAAMPGFIAKKLCPDLIIVPGNHRKYGEVSDEVQNIIKDYDANFTAMSLDEAYLDITDYIIQKNNTVTEEFYITPDSVVREIRQKVLEKTQLTASAGIASNGFLAKICGDKCKPDNQFFLEPNMEAIKSFIQLLPIRKVPGIGAVTEHLLKGLGINTCGDIWEKRGIINLLFKPASISFLISASLGLGGSFTSSSSLSEDRKSMSYERTFKGTSNLEELKKLTEKLSYKLEEELKNKEIFAKSVTLKIKTINFEVKTRVRTLPDYTASGQVIFQTAWSIYESYLKETPNLILRLLGVRVSTLKFNNSEDDENNSKNLKQPTIDKLFTKTQEEISNVECPVCLQKFSSIRHLDTHIDTCLLSVSYNEDEDTRVNSLNPNNFNTNQLNDHIINILPSTSKNAKQVQQLTKEEDKKEEDEKTLQFVQCPICFKNIKCDSSENSEIVINSHIDICLNIKTVGELIKDTNNKTKNENDEVVSSNSKKRPSNKDDKKSNSKSKKIKCAVKPIDSYFKKQ